MTTGHILIVDDDPQITSFLSRYLEKQHYQVSCTATAAEMAKVLNQQTVDLCILDIGLPDRDGFDILRDMRTDSNLPVIVLSGRDDPFDRVLGLEFGADDYVTKPFEARELLARIKTVLRRCRLEDVAVRQTSEGTPILQFDQFVMNAQERTLRNAISGKDVNLTTTEFELLHAMVKHPHSVLSRDQLLDLARGRQCYVGDRTVDVHIMRLRKKIEPDAANPTYVKTIHGIGYCFTADVMQSKVAQKQANDAPIQVNLREEGRSCPVPPNGTSN
ncbi:response regulator [Cohaesibacter gelatinilyticus]|uniref:Regulatory protein VirG n=1 Tax=Cohaesibacter gelatinilyticus TaxID=372072 RepID=A0A285NAF8_9HYPH|nr:response regulator transcription factor [Cohaesibacter gelatinilyticus]SNZ06455.1 two-component system, OmpR family, phosphate regulon response regulator OmpR [Cohaesibacter gelatinilyticus]